MGTALSGWRELMSEHIELRNGVAYVTNGPSVEYIKLIYKKDAISGKYRSTYSLSKQFGISAAAVQAALDWKRG
jgi:hypothetical protein